MPLPTLSDAVVSALIGGAAGWITALFKLRPERKKLLEEINLIRKQAEKFDLETDSFRRQQLESERAEIVDLLKAFDREVFDAPMQAEEPVAMFQAIRQTRIWLQTSGALYFHDPEIQSHFRAIRNLLAQTERGVVAKFPVIAELSATSDSGTPVYERRSVVESRLGRAYYEAVAMMMKPRNEVRQHVGAIEQRLPTYGVRRVSAAGF